MITAIKDIGDLISKTGLKSELTIEGKVLSIVIDIPNMLFTGIDIEDFDNTKIDKYLFSSGSSRGNAPSPFLPLHKKEPQRSFEKIERWFKKCEEINQIEEEERKFINAINQIIGNNVDSILSEIKTVIENLPKKKDEGIYLTIKFEGDRHYLGEHEIFKKATNKFADSKFYESFSSHEMCSICGMTKEEVSGKISVYKFYTDDKPGFITGGFNKNNVWKNYPVCTECKSLLENGKNYIETKLNFKFYGLSYCLIPKLLIGDYTELEEIISILSDTTKSIKVKEHFNKRITNDENEILEYLSEIKDVLTLDFLFLKKEQSAERILLLIEDVFPSRIRKIFKTKYCIDELMGEDFNLGRIRTFFSISAEGKRDSDLNKYFLEIVNKVFKGEKLDFSFLLKFYMSVIRREFIKDEYFNFRIKDAFMSMMFFENLNLITFEGVNDMEKSVFEEVLEHYGNSLKTPARRGIFLLGSLTQLLLNKQWSDRGAKPFMKKLKGLKMDEKDVKALLPNVQNKFEEYDSFDKGKRLIASESSKYLLEAGENWRMSIDEINFYFACGMNLIDAISEIAYPKDNNKKEE